MDINVNPNDGAAPGKSESSLATSRRQFLRASAGAAGATSLPMPLQA